MASPTTDISWLVFCYTVPSNIVVAKVLIILVFISFYSVFLSRSHS
jgi:hypothetical protein